MISPISRPQAIPELRRRLSSLNIGVAVVFIFIAVCIWVLQVLHGDRFTYLSEHNRIRIRKIPGLRGMIFDRKERLMVDSHPSFDLLFVPEDSNNPDSTLRHLAGLVGKKEGDFLNILSQSQIRHPFREITLQRDIPWRSVVAVETHQMDLPGVKLRIHPRRSYLNNAMSAHILGYLGEISMRRLKKLKNRGYEMGDEIGQSGLEKRWEEYLRGRDGGRQVEVDVLGREVQVLHEVKELPGHNVILTIDYDIQESAYKALDGKAGAIVVMDVNSGAILALVSSPSYDPNSFARGISYKAWQSLIKNKSKPLHNRAIQGQYPPGSIFKIVLAIAALEEKTIDPKTTLDCSGSIAFGNRIFRDWKKSGHGAVDLHRAIVESCDIYIYQLGQQLGVDQIARYARMLGLGVKSGIALDGEKEGVIPDIQWKKRQYNQPWYLGETPSVAIGQSYVSVTPIQIARLMAIVANGGKVHRPWFVNRVETFDGTIVRKYEPDLVRSVSLKKKTLDHIRKALRNVVSSKNGTGTKARSDRVNVAGKTGTAQVVKMQADSVKNEHLPYAFRDHAWFAGYAPTTVPEIAVVVLVEHGGRGGSVAAPLAKRVIDKYFSLKYETAVSSAMNTEEETIRAN